MIKVIINKDYLFKNYETYYNEELILKNNFQKIELEDKYNDCEHSDFDLVGSLYQFNPVKYQVRQTEQLEARYSNNVEAKIRTKYSLSDELALHRQREAKPAEWQEYYKFCEACKVAARNEEGF